MAASNTESSMEGTNTVFKKSASSNTVKEKGQNTAV